MKLTRSNLLFTLAILGLMFYVVAPIIFPQIANVRQPEILPVYTAMLGIGQLLKEDPKDD